MKLYPILISLLLCILAIQQEVAAADDRLPKSVINLLDMVLFDFLPKLFHQRPFNENGTFSHKFAELAFEDEANEDASTMSLQEIIVRSGYKYEHHYALSDDGYITQLTRLINPLVDPRELKQPPVALFHGGLVNPVAYVMASAIQHHPEKYPSLPGEIQTSSNRSVAFMLANNGFDVWLVGTRGATRESQGHLKYRTFQAKGFLFKDEWVDKPMSSLDKVKEAADTLKYWDWSMDDLIRFEVPRQIEKILTVTGSERISMFTFSMSTMYGISALAANPNLCKKVHNLIAMAPIINAKGINTFGLTLCRLYTRVDIKLGTVIFTKFFTSQLMRDILLALGQNRDLRYTIVKALGGYFCGSSPKYYTFLEGPVIGHIFETTGFKMIKHYAQQILSGRLQRFDYGFVQNLVKYGFIEPPVYDLKSMNLRSWMIISADNDNLATPSSVRQFLNEIQIWPEMRANYPRGNHLDLFAGFENDKYVNLPVLKYLNRNTLPSLEDTPKEPTAEETTHQEKLVALVPADTTILRV